MSVIVETLEAQHRAIAALVEDIDRSLASVDLDALTNQLARLRTELSAHLELEDRKLYPEFSRMATARARTLPLDIVSVFEKNMDSVSAALHAFLERYRCITADTVAELGNDWPLVRRMLSDRIDNEESTLYPLFRAWHSRST